MDCIIILKIKKVHFILSIFCVLTQTFVVVSDFLFYERKSKFCRRAFFVSILGKNLIDLAMPILTLFITTPLNFLLFAIILIFFIFCNPKVIYSSRKSIKKVYCYNYRHTLDWIYVYDRKHHYKID